MNVATKTIKKPTYSGIYNRYVKRGLDICISGIALVNIHKI